MSYPLSFLVRQAKQGNLNDSEKVLETLQSVRDGNLSTSLSPHEILDIIRDNEDFIQQHRANDLADSKQILKYWEAISDEYGEGSLSLLEFDDHYDTQRLCYAILINRVRRRITVVFRGTYADGTADWKRNLQLEQTEIPVPFNLQPILREREHLDDNQLSMKVHKGLYEYLFNNEDRGPKYETERYQEILKHLQTCMEENPGYKIYVTGHSAGGALAKLFAFYLSTSRQALHIPKPVTCICIGSLVMGDSGYAQAVSVVEQLGWLRHLSIKNEGDIICYTPPLQWYVPSGMHLRLHRNGGHLFWHPSGPGMQQYHDNSMASLMRVFRSAINRDVDLLAEHLVPCYLQRLQQEKESLGTVTMNDLYNDPNLICSSYHEDNASTIAIESPEAEGVVLK